MPRSESHVSLFSLFDSKHYRQNSSLNNSYQLYDSDRLLSTTTTIDNHVICTDILICINNGNHFTDIVVCQTYPNTLHAGRESHCWPTEFSHLCRNDDFTVTESDRDNYAQSLMHYVTPSSSKQFGMRATSALSSANKTLYATWNLVRANRRTARRTLAVISIIMSLNTCHFYRIVPHREFSTDTLDYRYSKICYFYYKISSKNVTAFSMLSGSVF